jgi:hypothetical protein
VQPAAGVPEPRLLHVVVGLRTRSVHLPAALVLEQLLLVLLGLRSFSEGGRERGGREGRERERDDGGKPHPSPVHEGVIIGGPGNLSSRI